MENNVRQHIATAVRDEMWKQHRTHRQLAAHMGLAQAGITLRLQGRRAWRAEELAAVAAWLGVPISQFIPDEVKT